MADKSSPLYRAVSDALKRVWNKPLRRLKKRMWRHGPMAWWARYRHLLLARSLRGNPANTSPQFMGGGKLVSVLLPSRGRPQGLLHAVSSLIVRCDDPACVEILIRMDDDDPDSQDMAGYLQSVFGESIAIDVITGPRRNGYHSLHEFVEEMCAVAHGDFLFLFNDDLTMDTGGWDTKIARFRDEFCVLNWEIFPNPNPTLNLFPVVHRKVHRLIGHFSKCGACDTWMQDISQRAGIERFCPIRGTHWREKNLENPDTTYQERAIDSLGDHFYSKEMANHRNADLAKVKSYLDRHGVQLQRIESAS